MQAVAAVIRGFGLSSLNEIPHFLEFLPRDALIVKEALIHADVFLASQLTETPRPERQPLICRKARLTVKDERIVWPLLRLVSIALLLPFLCLQLESVRT